MKLLVVLLMLVPFWAQASDNEIYVGYLNSVSAGKFSDVNIREVGTYNNFDNYENFYWSVSFGVFDTISTKQDFIKAGVSYRWWFNSIFIELGSEPTLLMDDMLNGKDLGGNIFFTTHLSAAYHFKESYIMIKLQHTSNGGLNSTNPGIDALGIFYGIDW